MNQRETEPWSITWLRMAKEIAKRSKDPSFQAGAVLVAAGYKTFLGCGFNGPPTRIDDDKIDWTDRSLKRSLCLHSESNAIWHAVAAHGSGALVDGFLFVNGRPCHRCCLEAVRAQLSSIIYDPTGSQPKMVDDDEFARTLKVASLSNLTLTPFTLPENS